MFKAPLPLMLIGIGTLLFLWKGEKVTEMLPANLVNSNSGRLIAHYPRNAAEIKRAGGFWKLTVDEQAGVRDQYVQELQMQLAQVDQIMRHAQYAQNLPACYVLRQMILQLQSSIRRAQNPSCDPTAEESTIAYMRAALSRTR